MRLLALDTSHRVVSATFFSGEQAARTLSEDAPLRANEALAPMVAKLLGGDSKVHAVAVCLGPGSFSGLRSGLGFAKAFAFAQGAKLLGISALDAWASFHAGDLEVWLDARKGRVYRGRYSQGKAVAAPDLVPLAEARAALGPFKAVGDLEGEGLAGLQASALSEGVGRLALARLVMGEADEPASLAPLYLQRPAPEVLWEQRGGK